MHTGQLNTQSVINEVISEKLVFDTNKNKYVFPALNVPNIFAIIDYDAHVNTKVDYAINHVFHSMTKLELNTLQSELERNQLFTKLAMSVKTPQLAGFFSTGIRGNFVYIEGSTAWPMIVQFSFQQYTKLMVVLIAFPYSSKILLCTLILSPDKPTIMLLL